MRFDKTDAEIARLSIPNVISNISVPILGIADTAIAGHIGSDRVIGALAIGTTIMDMIYWNCAFLRMGASGMTSQAYGQEDWSEAKRVLFRTMGVAVLLSTLLIALSVPISSVGLRLVGGAEDICTIASDYIRICFLAAPATIAMFGMNGWFIGMQDSKSPMWTAIISNIINIALSYTLAIGNNMGMEGIAWGTVGAQYSALAISLLIYRSKYRSKMPNVPIGTSFAREDMSRFFKINTDIFLRTLCVVVAYTFFTSASARTGEENLAANALLMQLFTLFSYLIDGVAYAAESLSGRYIGAMDKANLKKASTRLIKWGLCVGVLYSAVYSFAWDNILRLFNPSDEVIACAGRQIGWCIAIPIVASIPFIIDGIMIGATQCRALRNTVFFAMAADILIVETGNNFMGPTAIWIGFVAFLALRGILLVQPLKRLLD